MQEKTEGNVAKLAREVGGKTDETYLRNILNDVRNMGPPLARRIEKRYALPKGTMDAPNLGRAQTEGEGLAMRSKETAEILVFRDFSSAEQYEAIRHILELRKSQPGEKRG